MDGKLEENYMVQMGEETKNQNDDMLSLRFPVFKGVREIGKEVSYF